MVGPSRPFRRLVVLAALLVAGCGDARPTLSDISGVDALEEQFNADAGKPRIVLLLSPT